jgi:methylthioribose-1-phosphate isomerase
MYLAHAAGKKFTVYCDETRPVLQGARLTAWELTRAGIDVMLIADAAAARVMQEGRVQMVLTGADRIAANGDVANKIGSYGLAVLAGRHKIPFYVAAPCSTFDLTLADGGGIPIEHRAAEEVSRCFGHAIAPAAAGVYNPAFDVTPAELITGIITDRGIIQPVNRDTVAAVLGGT